MFPEIERMHQSEEYKQRQAEDAILRDIGRDRLVELARAEKDGRLVVLPCKVGDIVYFLPISGCFDSAEVDHFEVFKDKVMLAWAQYDRSYESAELWDMDEVDCTEVGTTVFLTSEEAKEAVSQIAQ